MKVPSERNQMRRLDRLRRQRKKLSDLIHDIRPGATRGEVAYVEEEARKFCEALARVLVVKEG